MQSDIGRRRQVQGGDAVETTKSKNQRSGQKKGQIERTNESEPVADKVRVGAEFG
jgi:hypothetical protein